MDAPPEVDYAVVLVFPGFGAERENDEAVVESALDWLNTHKDEPGFRFAPPVSAHLEIVTAADEARDRVEEGGGVAMVLLHDVEDGERDDLLRLCEARNVSACYTVDVPRRRGPRAEPMRVVLRSKPAKGPRAHTLTADTLTAPVSDDEETGARVGDVIAVLALGVMTHHWHERPPRRPF